MCQPPCLRGIYRCYDPASAPETLDLNGYDPFRLRYALLFERQAGEPCHISGQRKGMSQKRLVLYSMIVVHSFRNFFQTLRRSESSAAAPRPHHPLTIPVARIAV